MPICRVEIWLAASYVHVTRSVDPSRPPSLLTFAVPQPFERAAHDHSSPAGWAAPKSPASNLIDHPRSLATNSCLLCCSRHVLHRARNDGLVAWRQLQRPLLLRPTRPWPAALCEYIWHLAKPRTLAISPNPIIASIRIPRSSWRAASSSNGTILSGGHVSRYRRPTYSVRLYSSHKDLESESVAQPACGLPGPNTVDRFQRYFWNDFSKEAIHYMVKTSAAWRRPVTHSMEYLTRISFSCS